MSKETGYLNIDNRSVDTFKLSKYANELIRDLENNSTESFNVSDHHFAQDMNNSIQLIMPDGKVHSFVGLSVITVGRNDETRNITPILDLTDHCGDKSGVSRRHAKIVYIKQQPYLMDYSSKNGTKINGKKITPQLMTPIYKDDEIVFGNLRVIVNEVSSNYQQ